MHGSPAGDFDYDRHGHGYAGHRRADPRIASYVHRALGDARTVLNVGAGAGSYEPADRRVLAVEPSPVMRAQRPPYLLPAVDATAERLPFDSRSFDAAMAMVTVHQWPDPAAGPAELPSGGRSRRRDLSARRRKNGRSPPCALTWIAANGMRCTMTCARSRNSTEHCAWSSDSLPADGWPLACRDLLLKLWES